MFDKIVNAALGVIAFDIIINRVILNRESATEQAVKAIIDNITEKVDHND